MGYKAREVYIGNEGGRRSVDREDITTLHLEGTAMRTTLTTLSLVAMLAGLVAVGRGYIQVAAQDAGPSAGSELASGPISHQELMAGGGEATPTKADHAFVGAWIVDTFNGSDSDSPEIGINSSDGTGVGLGANRVASFSWEVVDARTVMVTGVNVTHQDGLGSYVVTRGLHELDETGNTWRCACTATVVGADGTVLDALEVPTSARRLPVQGPEMNGMALPQILAWRPTMPGVAISTE